MTTFLDRKALKAQRDANMLRIEHVHVPSWGGTVGIRVLTGTERDAYEAEIVGNKAGADRRLNLQNLRAKLVARCMVDDSGKALYDYRSSDDVGELGSLDAAGLDIVFKACQKLNGLTEADVQELTKN